ncbi:MAG: FAD/NAD(P)-binding oxidoreductase [Actinomycetota bacterium]|nr:FAD/NAD(P)-binding oxidoreductase [Actinomycetota bacterium]
MAKVVVLGGGVSGHTAALYLKRMLKGEHEVTVVTPNSKWNWIPSNIWVGVGKMTTKQVTFDLGPIYKRKGINYIQALATEIHPEGSDERANPFVTVRKTSSKEAGQIHEIEYDFLINATGPKLNFGATKGLGPDGNSLSVCTASHAAETADQLEKIIVEMEKGAPKTLVVGMGHGTCTCEGAAFEYTFNVEHELRRRGVRDKARVVYLSNEAELGDFGVGGMVFEQKGRRVSSAEWTESIFAERGVEAILGAHVEEVEEGAIRYEQLDGSKSSLDFDFAMLLPPFRGADLRAFDREGSDITETLFMPNGFMKVDANYTSKPFDEWSSSDWPKTYQNPTYDNIYAVGIAFSPPHQISRPRTSPNGTVIAPAPPRTGMPSGVMGRVAAESIADRIRNGAMTTKHEASMASMGAACIASAGTGSLKGTAAAMTMFPIVPDTKKYPTGGGRDLANTTGDIGLAAHWTKAMLHFLFIYKAKALPFWYLIPE